MVAAIYICHWPDPDSEYSRCELLLYRLYRVDVPSASRVVARFLKHYLSLKPLDRCPFLQIQGTTYVACWAPNQILMLAVTRQNIDAMLAVALLQLITTVLSHYFSRRPQDTSTFTHSSNSGFERDDVIDHASLVYELLDECVDFGLPQVTDHHILKEYIKTETQRHRHLPGDSDSDTLDLENPKRKTKSTSKKHITSTHNQAVRTDVVNASLDGLINSSIVRTQVLSILWRPKGIFYPKNEIYIDFQEHCDLMFDLETKLIRTNEVHGRCLVRCYLSGMPLCRLGLNETRMSQVEYDGDTGSIDEQKVDAEEADDEQIEDTTNTTAGASLEDSRLDDEAEELNEHGFEKLSPITLSSSSTSIDTLQPLRSLDSTSSDTTLRPKPHAKRIVKVPITNVRFHPCIELTKVYEQNLICFTPPDDEFELLSYDVEQQKRTNKKPPLLIDPVYKIDRVNKKLQVLCSLSSCFKKQLHCNKLIVRIPVNPNLFALEASDFRYKAEMGEVRFSVDASEIFWAIGDLPGSKKVVRMMAELKLADDVSEAQLAKELAKTLKRTQESDDSEIEQLDKYYGVGGALTSAFSKLQRNAALANEIRLLFEIPMFTYSGLRVKYLQVEEEQLKYTSFPWVRYMTYVSKGDSNSGSYRFRLGPTNFQFLD